MEMTRLESDKVLVQKNAKELYSFLEDFNNYGKLMPEQIEDWKSTRDECSFKIKGMATLGMKIVERKPNSTIIISENGAPFKFFLHCDITEKGSASEVQLAFEADLNPMMKMMASKPLTNFLNMLVSKMNTTDFT